LLPQPPIFSRSTTAATFLPSNRDPNALSSAPTLVALFLRSDLYLPSPSSPRWHDQRG
jgi:hypothetical protein